MELLNTLVLIAYHGYQANDLRSDLRHDEVQVLEIHDWQKGWKSNKFDISVLDTVTPIAAILTNQHNTYIKAAVYHEERLATLQAYLATLPEYDESIRFDLKEINNFCDTFKFGTEPKVEEILRFLLTYQIKGEVK